MKASEAGRRVTPLLLTYNEAPNLARTLASLHWAQRIVVLDSGSVDDTEKIARNFENVDWRVRPFDSFKSQTEYGIQQTGIDTEYILALDADMSLSPGLLEEIEQQFLPGDYDGGLLAFRYCIAGRPLAGSLYPSQLRLFRRGKMQIAQVGHGHKFHLTGSIYRFNQPLLHDDRKPLETWVTNQLAYAADELRRMQTAPRLKFRDRLRQWGLMPLVIGPYAYFKAGGPFCGIAAARYAYERVTFECLLALRTLTARLEEQGDKELPR